MIAGALFAKNYDQAQLDRIVSIALDWYKQETVPCFLLKLAMLFNKVDVFKAIAKNRKVDYARYEFG